MAPITLEVVSKPPPVLCPGNAWMNFKTIYGVGRFKPKGQNSNEGWSSFLN
jgi:hypothetical protein